MSPVAFAVIIAVILPFKLFRPSQAFITSHPQAQNLSCEDWAEAPEALAGNCTRFGRYGPLACYGGMNNLPAISAQKVRKLEEVILCGYPQKTFDPVSDLKPFPKIRSLTIEYSGLSEMPYEFPEMLNLQSINISWTNLSSISPRTFKRVPALKVVDLRWNQLIQLDGPLLLPRSFERLYLAGNPWNCTRNFKWLLQPDNGAVVADREQLVCTDRKYKDRLMMIVMHYKVALKTACQSHEELQNCTCLMHHIIPKTHIPLYTVNCSNQNLLQLPSYLPENTTMLFMNNNSISDLQPLRNNPHYRNVEDLHLDNNLVTSIDDLEGGYWLEHFRLLSLRGNLLRKIPVYALNNALEDNANANLFLLSRNPWFCTCKFTLRFREMLIKYNDIFRDAANITCQYQQGEEMRSGALLAITREDVCKQSEDPKVHPLDLLNATLAALILFILGKLAYDYYYYKNYGRVPWIVMKLP